MKTCPECKEPAWRAYYHGVPMWLCSEDSCGMVWGFWAWILKFHFDGQFEVKEDA